MKEDNVIEMYDYHYSYGPLLTMVWIWVGIGVAFTQALEPIHELGHVIACLAYGIKFEFHWTYVYFYPHGYTPILVSLGGVIFQTAAFVGLMYLFSKIRHLEFIAGILHGYLSVVFVVSLFGLFGYHIEDFDGIASDYGIVVKYISMIIVDVGMYLVLKKSFHELFVRKIGEDD